MNRRMKKMLSVLILAILLFHCMPMSVSYGLSRPSDMRGIWISSVHNIDFPSQPALSASKQQEEILSILDAVKQAGMNTVFFQVRPCCDALYKSEIFPWSSYLTGTQGTANDNGFDPLAFFIQEGHKRGIRIHAWINPLRVATGNRENPAQLNRLASNNPARKNPGLTVSFEDGNIYLDPGLPEARKLICEGVLEIANNYDVDGIVFDDYFYPQKMKINDQTVDFDDSASYQKYGKGKDLSDWRRDNITTLISDVHKTVRDTKKGILFGVSPFGIWADKEKDPNGSETSGGLSSCLDQYADTKKWVETSILDYIAPQIYWNIGYESSDFTKLLSWWENTCKNSGVSLYIAHALYKVGDNTQSDTWLDPLEIQRQLTLVKDSPVAKGSVLYGYSKLKENTLNVSDSIRDFYRKNVVPETVPMPPLPQTREIIIAAPGNNYKTASIAVSILGSADPAHPLLLNKKEVQMTENGYFTVYESLTAGENTFIFSQNGKQKTLTVEKTAAIPPASTDGLRYYPNQKEMKAVSGYKMPLSFSAPAGSRVYAAIGQTSLLLFPDFGFTSLDPSLCLLLYGAGVSACPSAAFSGAVSYKGCFTLPESKSETDLGRLIFTVVNGLSTDMILTETKITCLKPNSYTAVFKNSHSKVSAGQSSPYSLSVKGAQDSILFDDGETCLLSSGLSVSKNDIEINNTKCKKNYISSISFSEGTDSFCASFKTMSPPLCTVTYDNDSLSLFFYRMSTRFLPKINSKTISGIDFRSFKNGGQYTFHLDQPICGYSYNYEKGKFVFLIKTRESESMIGKTILLDAGHGGSSPGALGPLGESGPYEKHIALAVALYTKAYLENLGATVLLTREDDSAVDLYDRVDQIQAADPDLMISVHANAVSPDVDYAKRSGLFAFYSSDISEKAASVIADSLTSKANIKNNGALYQSLAVCRLSCCPCVLLELGFMTNPGDYEMLSNSERQKEMASALADAVCDYFATIGN